jgi:hypothetical protein
MAWVYDQQEFEYEDWAPYAVFEANDVLVIKSEGDFFFAVKTATTGGRWQPLPMENETPEDLDRLRLVVARMLEAERRYQRELGLPERAPANGESAEDYDALWGIAQQIGFSLQALAN